MKQTQEKIKLVVLNEHTLGFIFPQSYYEKPLGLTHVNILHASVLKGAIQTLNPVLLGSTDNVRLASEKDFDSFRVYFGSFANEQEYEYAKV